MHKHELSFNGPITNARADDGGQGSERAGGLWAHEGVHAGAARLRRLPRRAHPRDVHPSELRIQGWCEATYILDVRLENPVIYSEHYLLHSYRKCFGLSVARSVSRKRPDKPRSALRVCRQNSRSSNRLQCTSAVGTS